MWRRRGDDLSASVFLLVFTVEAVTLGALTWAFVLRLADQLAGGQPWSFLVLAVSITALVLMVIGAHVLGYRAISSHRRRGSQHRLEAWTERWVAVLFEGQGPPPRPLPREAVEALLDLRDALVGTEGERVEWLVRRYDLGEDLLRRARAVDRAGAPRRASSLRRRRLASRLEALEALAKARIPPAVDPLIGLLADREPAVRVMALRAVARTLARLPEGADRAGAAGRFVAAIGTADVPPGAIEESLLLLEGAGPPVLHRLLAAAQPEGPDPEEPEETRLDEVRLARVIDAVGRLKVVTLADQVAPFGSHPNPEVRAAALRALGSVGVLPPAARQAAAQALTDPVEYVRVQAARTASLLSREEARRALWELLGDGSWWVRRSAARGVLELGRDGPRVLEQAGSSHPDRYARHMALQVLLEEGHLDAARARRLRGVG
jgi:HEAT repeat protein